MLEKPALCFLLLQDDNLFPRLISSLNTRPTQGIFSAELVPLEATLLTTIACFRLCRTLYKLSEQVHVTRWQPWLHFTLPDLAPFVADPYMNMADHLTQLALSAAQALRELATYVLRGSHALVYIAELSVIERVGLLLHVVVCREAHQELLEALQGLLSALCVTARGMVVVLAAYTATADTRWRRALCRVPTHQEAWVAGWGLLHYAFEVGLGVDLPAGGDEHERIVAGARGVERPYEMFEVATVCTRVYGAVLCESLSALGEAAASFTILEVLRLELGTEPSQEHKTRILGKMARLMSVLAGLCMWQYGREVSFFSLASWELTRQILTFCQAVYIAGHHSGSLDYLTRLARHIGQEFESHNPRWTSPESLDLYRAARIVEADMVTVGRAFEPLMTMHPDNDTQSTPQLLLLDDIQARLADARMQLTMLCDSVDKPHLLLDPEFVSHLETAVNAMTTNSMHSALYVKMLFTTIIELRIAFSLPAFLSLALNGAAEAAYLAAAIIPPPPNYVPGASSGLRTRKAPTPDIPLYKQGPPMIKDAPHRRRTIINNRTAMLRLVCSLTALLRRTVKHLYGNTDVGFTGVMNLGDLVHGDHILALEAAAPKPPADPDRTWATYFAENRTPLGPETVAEDPLAQWPIARVALEALLNAHSIGADKAGLYNASLVELIQNICAHTIKMLLETTAAKTPKYLGRNGAFFLLAHIAADALIKHRISPLESNLQLAHSIPGIDSIPDIPALTRLHTIFGVPKDSVRVPLPVLDIAEWVFIQDRGKPKVRPAKIVMFESDVEVGWRSQMAVVHPRMESRQVARRAYIDHIIRVENEEEEEEESSDE